MPQLWFFWTMSGITVLVLAVVGVSIWMLIEYLRLPGHFEVRNKLVGEVGVVKADVTAHQRGKVYIAGAYWDAVCEHGAIAAGRDIQVTAVKDKFLVVRPVDLTGANEPR